jgi:hypothetical protein
MAYAVAAEEVEPVVRGLLGLIDVDGGPTAEQLNVLWSITGHLWRRPDLAGASLSPLSPRELAAALDDERARRRFHVIAVTLELCRHPLSEAQVRSTEAYAAALDIDGADLLIMRDWIDVGVGQAMEDWKRCFGSLVETTSEAALRTEEPLTEAEVWEPQGPDAAMLGRLLEFRDLPDGSLGREYLNFYERNGITLPGVDKSGPLQAVAIGHDMNHVIAGYEPTGQGEIALGAFQMALSDSEEHLVGFLGNLLIHEAGVLDPGGFVPKSASLLRPGAIEMLGEAFERGAKCRADFTGIDHLAIASWDLAEVREEYGVVPVTLEA